MMTIMTMIAVVLTLPAGAQEQTLDKKIIGHWKPTKLTFSGNDVPQSTLKQWTISISDDGKIKHVTPTGVESSLINRTIHGTYQVDVSGMRNHIDIEGFEGQVRLVGIFKFRDEKLVACLRTGDGKIERPTAFGDGTKDGEMFIVLKRK